LSGLSLYLPDVFRKKLDFPSHKRAVIELTDRFRPSTILIEDKASGTQLIQDLREARLSRVRASTPADDKVMRMHARRAIIENGFVQLPSEAAWVDEYIRELTTFPVGRHDDQVDSISQALAWKKIRSPADAFLEYMRQQVEELHRSGL
jgi:predicted phage terminase large subunit-like protein